MNSYSRVCGVCVACVRSVCGGVCVGGCCIRQKLDAAFARSVLTLTVYSSPPLVRIQRRVGRIIEESLRGV